MSKTIQIAISDLQAAEILELVGHMRDNATFEDGVRKCLDQGITQLSYRYKRNATQWSKMKEDKALLAQLILEKKIRQQKEQMEDDDVVARD